MEKQREKHKEAQKKYRLINKEKLNEYNKKIPPFKITLIVCHG